MNITDRGIAVKRGCSVVYHEPTPRDENDTSAYAAALMGLHAKLRAVEVEGIEAPHFTERARHAEMLMDDPALVPAVSGEDRALILNVLRDSLASAGALVTDVQLLHGEPHSDNVLRTQDGLLFTDFEAICRGPIEFDLADAPEELADLYLDANQELLRVCRSLVLAMVATWCWNGFAEHENLRRGAQQLTEILRSAAR